MTKKDLIKIIQEAVRREVKKEVKKIFIKEESSNKLSDIMKTEYEEFENIEDLFMYMSAAAPPMKNTIPINSYKGSIMSFIPLSPSTGESYLMLYAKGELEAGIYEFDVSTKSYKKVESVERADKIYFISITPKRNTIADQAIQGL